MAANAEVIHPDVALVRRAVNGDPAAFETLVDAFRGRIDRFLFAVLGHPGDAEETCQEVFLSAFRGLQGLRSHDAFTPWLFKIAANAARARLRARASRPGELGREAFDESRWSTAQAAWPPGAWARPPDARILDGELGDVVGRAIAGVASEARMALVLRDIEGFGTRETALALEREETWVRTNLHRARAQVRDEVGKYLKAA